MADITNKARLEIAPALWLLEDFYDYNPDPHVISATGLLSPVRPIILASQAANDDHHSMDVLDLVGSRMGSALHDSLEDCWKDVNRVRAGLKQLKIPQKVIDRVRINPNKLDLVTNPLLIPIYIENRASKKLGKWTISGKYDLVFDGEVQDYKSCSAWAYVFDSNSADYILQGSIYRWLNPDKITKDTVRIHYIFTDWSKSKALQDKKSYPQTRILSREYRLKPMDWIESFMRNKLDTLESLLHAKQKDLPLCTPEELWQKDTKYKYYKNPNNTARSTANFDVEQHAQTRWADDGGVGKVITVPGEVVRCKYCNSMEVCEQAAGYIKSGLIKFE
jgi:hypothetical protein